MKKMSSTRSHSSYTCLPSCCQPQSSQSPPPPSPSSPACATNVTLNISSTTDYLDEGNPKSYLPAPHQPWILNTYNRQSRHEPASGRTYTSLFTFNPEGTLRCSRRLKEDTPGHTTTSWWNSCAGNLYEIGADRYTYDQANRLT